VCAFHAAVERFAIHERCIGREYWLKVCEKRALRKIFGSERDEAIGYWRRLHNEELHDMYSPNVIRLIKSRRMRWARHVAHMGERIGACRVVVGKPEGERPLRIPTRKWEIILKWM
jgi:hypothetical protein